MIVVDTVDFIIHVHREWNTVEAFVANAATETSGMVRFAHCLKNLRKKWDDLGDEGTKTHNTDLQLHTISMIKCPQIAHFSAVCWKPEYCKILKTKSF